MNKYEIIIFLTAIFLIIVSVLFYKAIWESDLPEWLKIIVLTK